MARRPRLLVQLAVLGVLVAVLGAACAPPSSPSAPATEVVPTAGVASPGPGTVGTPTAEPRAADPTATGRRLVVVTSATVFADIIRRVGGDRVEVHALVPPGADVHTFQPAPGDAQRLAEADVVFVNGLGFERALDHLVESARRPTTPVVHLAEGLVPSSPPASAEGEHEEDHDDARAPAEPDAHGHEEAHGGAGTNPHFWLDPRHGIHYVERVRDGLASVDPEGQPVYAENARRYVEELRALDRELEQRVRAIPPERRKLVTFHDAFVYLAERYDLSLAGVVVVDEEHQPSPRELQDLAQRVREERIQAVFAEPQMPARTVEVLARETGARVCRLYSDALDQSVRSYVDLLRHNADQLVACLGQG